MTRIHFCFNTGGMLFSDMIRYRNKPNKVRNKTIKIIYSYTEILLPQEGYVTEINIQKDQKIIMLIYS